MYRELILNSAALADISSPQFRIPPVIMYGFRIVSCSFLQSWDGISDMNSTIMWAEQGDGSLRRAELPRGTYTSASITDVVAEALTASGTQQYTASYDPITRRLTVSTTDSLPFKLASGSRGSTSYLQLGLSQTADLGLGMQLTLPNCLNLAAAQPLLLCSRTLQNDCILYPSGAGSGTNALACIQPDVGGDLVYFENPSTEFFRMPETSISEIDLSLVDSASMRTINLTSPLVVVIGFYDDPQDLA